MAGSPAFTPVTTLAHVLPLVGARPGGLDRGLDAAADVAELRVPARVGRRTLVRARAVQTKLIHYFLPAIPGRWPSWWAG